MQEKTTNSGWTLDRQWLLLDQRFIILRFPEKASYIVIVRHLPWASPTPSRSERGKGWPTSHMPLDIRYWTNVDPVLCQRQRRWHNTGPALGKRIKGDARPWWRKGRGCCCPCKFLMIFRWRPVTPEELTLSALGEQNVQNNSCSFAPRHTLKF